MVWTPPFALRLVALAGAAGMAVFTGYKIGCLGLGGLPGEAYIPGFLPIVLALILLAFPSQNRAGNRPLNGP